MLCGDSRYLRMTLLEDVDFRVNWSVYLLLSHIFQLHHPPSGVVLPAALLDLTTRGQERKTAQSVEEGPSLLLFTAFCLLQCQDYHLRMLPHSSRHGSSSWQHLSSVCSSWHPHRSSSNALLSPSHQLASHASPKRCFTFQGNALSEFVRFHSFLLSFKMNMFCM